VAACFVAVAGTSWAYTTLYSRTQRLPFVLRIADVQTPYPVASVFVLPNQILKFGAVYARSNGPWILRTYSGKTYRMNTSHWTWQVPDKPGIYPMRICDLKSGRWATINIFAMVPYRQMEHGYLNGYRIGEYPKARGSSPIFKEPAGFVEVTAENEGTLLSPHFRLGQFVCRQRGGYPKYVVLREELIVKLELIVDRLNASGIPCNELCIMSGYRTPYHNRAIGSQAYSLHVMGGAADFCLVDNLAALASHSRKSLYRREQVLRQIIEDIDGKPYYHQLAGGLGVYRTSRAHGPFVHVDVRGDRIRWTR